MGCCWRLWRPAPPSRRRRKRAPCPPRRSRASSSSPPTGCGRTSSTATSPTGRCRPSPTLKATGVSGDNGLLQAFPPNTGTGWAHPRHRHLARRARLDQQHLPPRRRGRLRQLAPAPTSPASSRPTPSPRRPSGPARRSSPSSGSAPAATTRRCKGPVVDFRTFFSDRGVLTNYDLPGSRPGPRPSASPTSGSTSQPADGLDATSPSRSARPMEQQLLLTNDRLPGGGQRRPRLRPLHLRLDRRRRDQLRPRPGRPGAGRRRRATAASPVASPAATGKDGAAAVADLAAGEWADVKVTLAGERDGQTAGFYLKAIEIAPDLSQFRLYYTSIARPNATYNGCDYAADCAGPLGLRRDAGPRLPERHRRRLRPAGGADHRRGDLRRAGRSSGTTPTEAYLRYIVEDLGVEPDLLLLGTPVTDEFSHQFLGLTTRDQPRRQPEPLLRRPRGRRHAGRPGRRARRLHPLRLRDWPTRPSRLGQELLGGRDHLRLLRPRLRPRLLRGQRRSGAPAGRDRRRRADLQLPRARTAEPDAGATPDPDAAADRPAGEGLLGRRHAPRSTSTSSIATRPASSPRRSTRRSATRSSPPSRA